jgi:hypothetical protein
MNGTFDDYLRGLGMGDQFILRVAQLHDECQSLTENEIEEIFVSEQIVQGERKYIALHFFTKSSVFRFKNFIDQFNIELHRLDGVALCEFSKIDFDLKNGVAKQKSAMQVTVTWEPFTFSLQLLASRANCAHLVKLMKKYVFFQLI